MSIPVLCFSLVLYKHSVELIRPLLVSIRSFADSSEDLQVLLFVYDASPTGLFPSLEAEISLQLGSVRLSYEKGENVGFGIANNFNFNRSNLRKSDLFVIVNPDIRFAPYDLLPLVHWLLSSNGYSCVAPLIFLENGSIQYSAKRDPTLLSLLLGRFPWLLQFSFFKRYQKWHKNLEYDYSIDIISSSYLSGCFLLVPAWAFLSVGGFCKHYFLHVEDADLVRRLSGVGKTIHNPIGRVVHGWARGSHSSIKQSISLIRSYIVYCWIWGLRLM